MPVLPELNPDTLHEVAKLACRAHSIFVSTGAGVSAESGVPTFRDAQTGLWAKYDPVMLASYDGFTRDLANVWRWYDERRQNIRACQPNQGHSVLAEWEQHWRGIGRRFQLATQNIDNLHRLAGSTELIELHGNIWQARPLDGALNEAFDFPDCPLSECPPRDSQGRLLRPHVVWFGEMLDPRNLDAAFHAAANCDFFIVAGSSSVVYPAAALPLVAQRARAVVVEVNPNPTEITEIADYWLSGPSGVVLPQLWEQVRAVTAAAG